MCEMAIYDLRPNRTIENLLNDEQIPVGARLLVDYLRVPHSKIKPNG